MKIVADENMPRVKELFAPFSQIELVNGRTLVKEQLQDADALLVRSVTKVDERLLAGTPVKFVGSATIGVDHIDAHYLHSSGVGFASAPGCNADAVADYVFSSLGYLVLTKGVRWLSSRIGIIGYGNVGQTVYDRFNRLGCKVCVYDPFKADIIDDPAVKFTTLDEVLSCQVISLHAPLTTEGVFPTLGMIGEKELKNVSLGATIISAGRGGVINEEALLEHYNKLNGELNLILDVWEGEPIPKVEMMEIADIATPHIAGYSKQGREKGTWMVYRAFCDYFGYSLDKVCKDALTQGRLTKLDISGGVCDEVLLARVSHAIYDVARDDSRMRRAFRSGVSYGTFDWLRKHYVERDEFNTCTVTRSASSDLKLLHAIGFSI